MSDDTNGVYNDFTELVNMSSKELETWLETEESQSVGIKKGTQADKKESSDGEESTGHESGRKITAILAKNKADLTDDDYAHMKKVNAYIRRHLSQEPTKGDIESSRWRSSLMNWGHDPIK